MSAPLGESWPWVLIGTAQGVVLAYAFRALWPRRSRVEQARREYQSALDARTAELMGRGFSWGSAETIAEQEMARQAYETTAALKREGIER